MLLIAGLTLTACEFLPGSRRICFLTLQDGKKHFLDEGTIYLGDKLIGRTTRGCVRLTGKDCNADHRAVFRPDSTKTFSHTLRSPRKIDSCRGADIRIPQAESERFYRLKWALPYVDNIILDDAALRSTASEVTGGCRTDTCKVFKIYRHMLASVEYIEDPVMGGEHISSPRDTLKRGGGDCEDLTALLNSYLENMGIKTFIVLTEKHAYSLACGMDIPELKKRVNDSLYKGLEERTISLAPGKSIFIDKAGAGLKWMRKEAIIFRLRSTQPVKVMVMGSRKDYELFEKGLPYLHHSRCEASGVRKLEKICNTEGGGVGGLMIENTSGRSARVGVAMEYVESDSRFALGRVTYYKVAGSFCVVLEPTAGENGYPGYSLEKQSLKIAIDPRTYKVVDLK